MFNTYFLTDVDVLFRTANMTFNSKVKVKILEMCLYGL